MDMTKVLRLSKPGMAQLRHQARLGVGFAVENINFPQDIGGYKNTKDLTL